MWERFTEHAKDVVRAAQEEAIRLGSAQVRTAHILLALCREPAGIGIQALVSLGVDVKALVRETEDLERWMPAHSRGPDPDNLAFTLRAKKVFGLAVEEAQRLNHSYVGTEHILLGLCGDSHGIAAVVLQKAKIDVDGVRTKILNLLRRPGDRGQIVGKSDAPAGEHADPEVTEILSLLQRLGDREETAGESAARAGEHANRGVRRLQRLFAEPAKRVVRTARDEAILRGSPQVRTEHLLLGLCKDTDGIAARALGNLGLEPGAIAHAIEQRTRTRLGSSGQDDIAFSPSSKRALARAAREMQRLRHHAVDAEHILLAILNLDEGIAADVLQDMEIDAGRVRAEVIRLLQERL